MERARAAWRARFRFHRFNLSAGDVVCVVALLIAAAAILAKPTAYAVSFSYCAAHKSAEKCARPSYRIGKFFEKIVSLIHPIIGILFLPLSKNSALAFLFGSSFERAVAWHRFVGKWLVTLLSAAHGVGFIGKWTIEGQLYEKIFERKHGDTITFYGVVAFVALISLFAFSLDVCRRHCYNLFRASHILFAIIFLTFVAMHYDGEKLFAWLALPLALLAVDVVWRAWKARANSTGAQIVAARQIGSRFAHLRFRTSNAKHFKPAPGQWAFVCVPCVSRNPFWKPLSLIPTSEPHEFELLVACKARKRPAWSTKLFETIADKGALLNDSRILLDGPYGSLSLPAQSLSRYDNVLLIAGGVGISAVLGMIPKSPGGGYRCRLVWALRDASLRDVFAHRLESGFADVHIALTCNSREARDDAKVPLRARSDSSCDVELLESASCIDRSSSRPDVAQEIRAACSRAMGGWTAVIVCGPQSMVNAAQAAAHELRADGMLVSFHKEVFEW